MTPALWVLLGYVGCWLHIIAASHIGAWLRQRRIEQTNDIRLDDYRRGITQAPERGRGA